MRAAAAAVAPNGFGPAAAATAARQRRAADRDDGRELRRLLNSAAVIAAVAAAGKNDDAGMVVVGRVRAAIRSAPAVADDVSAQPDRFIVCPSETSPFAVFRFDERDVAVGTGRRNHVDVERDLRRPIRIGGWKRMLLAFLVELLETVVEGRADWQPKFITIDEEILVGLRIVERIDERDGLSGAVRRRR